MKIKDARGRVFNLRKRDNLEILSDLKNRGTYNLVVAFKCNPRWGDFRRWIFSGTLSECQEKRGDIFLALEAQRRTFDVLAAEQKPREKSNRKKSTGRAKRAAFMGGRSMTKREWEAFFEAGWRIAAKDGYLPIRTVMAALLFCANTGREEQLENALQPFLAEIVPEIRAWCGMDAPSPDVH